MSEQNENRITNVDKNNMGSKRTMRYSTENPRQKYRAYSLKSANFAWPPYYIR